MEFSFLECDILEALRLGVSTLIPTNGAYLHLTIIYLVLINARIAWLIFLFFILALVSWSTFL